jgi:hypothetical protein
MAKNESVFESGVESMVEASMFPASSRAGEFPGAAIVANATMCADCEGRNSAPAVVFPPPCR